MPSPFPQKRLADAIASGFSCERCGNCCKGPGLVHFTADEGRAMAAHLGIGFGAFARQYAKRDPDTGQYLLKDRTVAHPDPARQDEYWCIFLERDAAGLYGCRVNAVKPEQCRTFPYEWRNPDSLRTCLALRLLLQTMRAEDAAADVRGAG